VAADIPTKTVAAAANAAWYGFKHYHAGSAEDPQLSYLAGYRRGVADMMADQFGFAGWDTLTHHLADVLDELVLEREAVRLVTDDVEERAYAWAMSNAAAEERAIAHPDGEEQEELPF
jgi:hypothetical protein